MAANTFFTCVNFSKYNLNLSSQILTMYLFQSDECSRDMFPKQIFNLCLGDGTEKNFGWIMKMNIRLLIRSAKNCKKKTQKKHQYNRTTQIGTPLGAE